MLNNTSLPSKNKNLEFTHTFSNFTWLFMHKYIETNLLENRIMLAEFKIVQHINAAQKLGVLRKGVVCFAI